MKWVIGAAFLLAAFRGQDEIARLVEQLSSEDVATREAAAERLVEIGTPARGALEKALKSRDVEVAARARSILGEIELEENRRRAMGPAGRVSLPAGEHLLGEIARRVREQTSVPLDVPESVAQDRVRIEARNELLWEFIDRLCRTHGGLRLPLAVKKDSITLESGKPQSGPIKNTGPFRVWIERIRLESRDPFEIKWQRGYMTLGITWQPNVHPIGRFHLPRGSGIKEIIGEDGKQLEMKGHRDYLYSGGSGGRSHARTFREQYTFAYPAPGVKRLSAVRGHVELFLPLRYEQVTFDKPAEAVGTSRKIGNYTISIKEITSDVRGFAALIRAAIPERTPETARDRRVEMKSRLLAEDAVLVDGGGKEHRGTSNYSGHSSGSGEESQEIRVNYPALDSPAVLRVRFLADYFEKRIEFEFKDVELP